MRILAVQDTDWFERGPHQQHHLLERLSLRGHNVRVLDYPLLYASGKVRGNAGSRQCFLDGARYTPGANIEVVRPGIITMTPLDLMTHAKGMASEIQRQCRQFKPDLILGHGILSDWGAVRACTQHHIPYVSHVLDALHRLVEPPVFRGIAWLIEQRNLRHANRVIVINRALREYVVSMGANPDRISVIPAGIDPSWHAMEVGRDRMRERLNIKADETVLFFMGWLYRFSGVLELAESLVKMGREGNELRFLIVGEGDLLEDLLRVRDTNQNGERLILVGKQPYEIIPDYLAAADICVLPAENNETMRHIVPIKVYEYLAAGRTVLATELPGIKTEFGYENGIVYVKSPSLMLAEALRLRASRKSVEAGAKCRTLIRQNSWEAVTDRFEEILSAVVQGARRMKRRCS